jgi:hypothetical protein
MLPGFLANRANVAIGILLLWGSVSVQAQSTAVSSIAPPTTVYDLGTKPEITEPQPLVNWLPIWGQGARDKGFDLPLPFGLGLTYTISTKTWWHPTQH